MEILIISGLSGGGKSKAASFLEDMGYYIVDNLPAELMLKFADLCAASQGRYGRVALVFDVRATHDFHEFFHVLDRLKGREGFRDFPVSCFEIHKMQVDRAGWTDGFSTVRWRE